MEDQYWTRLFKGFALSLSIDFSIALVLSNIFSNSRDVFESSLLIFLCILAVEAFVGLRNWFAKSLWFHWFGKNQVKLAVLTALREANLPPPGEYDARSMNYLLDLADNDKESPSDRVKSAILYTRLKALWDSFGVTVKTSAMLVADDAFRVWTEESPKRRKLC